MFRIERHDIPVRWWSTTRPQRRHYRQLKGYSQERFAHEVGVSTSTVANWENREYSPQVKYRPRLAEVLGVTLTELAVILDDVEPAASPVINGAVLEWLSLFARAEQAASTVCTFEDHRHPGPVADHDPHRSTGARAPSRGQPPTASS
jgi:transcriptional regulator with XRE-family HTH domain